MRWDDKKEVKKGNIGESIIQDFLIEKGFIFYRPAIDGAHKIDFFAHKSGAKKKVIAVEVKSKRRMAFRLETGFNYSNYLHYKEILEDHNIDTFFFFVDDFEECIYGAWLSQLGEGCRIGDVIVWSLRLMKVIRKLTKEEVSHLKNKTNERIDYTNVVKFFT